MGDIGAHAGLLAAFAYGFISITITLFNKVVLSTYAFDGTLTLTLLQGLVTIACLTGLKLRGYIDYPPFAWDIAKRVAPLSFVFMAYVVISLVSLGRVNVPMFTALRRLTVVFVMVEEYYLLGISPSRSVILSVGIMCLGAAIAAWRDLSYDSVSYFYLLLTNLFTSLYTVNINVVKRETKLNVWSILIYNNVTTLPFLFLLAWYTGDLQRTWNFPHMHNSFFQVNFQASIFLAVLLNVSTFYCTTLNSARTQTVVGQLKNFVAFLLGLVLFEDYHYDFINLIGLVIGFLGGVLYSYISFADNMKGQPPAIASTLHGAQGISAPADSISQQLHSSISAVTLSAVTLEAEGSRSASFRGTLVRIATSAGASRPIVKTPSRGLAS